MTESPKIASSFNSEELSPIKEDRSLYLNVLEVEFEPDTPTAEELSLEKAAEFDV
jgi:hypothetical protein